LVMVHLKIDGIEEVDVHQVIKNREIVALVADQNGVIDALIHIQKVYVVALINQIKIIIMEELIVVLVMEYLMIGWHKEDSVRMVCIKIQTVELVVHMEQEGVQIHSIMINNIFEKINNDILELQKKNENKNENFILLKNNNFIFIHIYHIEIKIVL